MSYWICFFFWIPEKMASSRPSFITITMWRYAKMRDNKWSKGCLKRWCDKTVVREGSYTEFARPDNGVWWGSERFLLDNRRVVPYNFYFMKKYGARLKVKIACGVRLMKYLVKYIYKGSDRATFAAPREYKKIEATLQGRYIGPAQAIWRLMWLCNLRRKATGNDFALSSWGEVPCHLQGQSKLRTSCSRY